MILEVDGGNSALKWRVIDSRGGILGRGRSLLSDNNMLNRLAQQFPQVQLVRLSCVASEDVRQSLAQRIFDLWALEGRFAETKKSFAGLTVVYDDAGRLGVDRWLAMLAAFHETAGPVCVFDCGSAITVDLVVEKGVHKGGYIIPGIKMQRDALLENTELIRIEKALESHNFGWGCSTEEAVNFGISRMVAGFIDSIVDELLLSGPLPALFLTGGDAALLMPLLKHAVLFELRSELVLDGLQVAFE